MTKYVLLVFSICVYLYLSCTRSMAVWGKLSYEGIIKSFYQGVELYCRFAICIEGYNLDVMYDICKSRNETTINIAMYISIYTQHFPIITQLCAVVFYSYNVEAGFKLWYLIKNRTYHNTTLYVSCIKYIIYPYTYTELYFRRDF